MRHVIGMADLKVSTDSSDVLVTYALGSCLGVTVHDPVARVGGILHVMLPQSMINEEKARENPAMFVDTGVPKLIQDCIDAGAHKLRMIIVAVGGASTSRAEGDDHFEIGKRNFIMLRKILWKTGLLLKSHDVGGAYSRTLFMEVGSGDIKVTRTPLTQVATTAVYTVTNDQGAV